MDIKNVIVCTDMKLINKDGEISLNLRTWHKLLKTGLHFGWKPLGTSPPEYHSNESWNERCSSDDGFTWAYEMRLGQKVTKQDALNLANAIEKGLPSVVFSSEEEKAELTKYCNIFRSGEFIIKDHTTTVDQDGNVIVKVE